MRKTLRGRPALSIPLGRIMEAVRRHGQVVAAARELGCSGAYVHKRFRAAGISLAEVLEGPLSLLPKTNLAMKASFQVTAKQQRGQT
jgi:hypothetical protein